MIKRKKEKGLTTMELIIVIAIITIIPAVVISNFPQIRLQFALARVTHRFAQDLRRAQDSSLSFLVYKDQFGTERPVSGYGVYVNLSSLGNKKYLVYADKSVGNRQYDVLDYIVETIDFSLTEKGVLVKEINNVFGNIASVNFNPPIPNTTITQLQTGQNKVDVVFALESDLTKTRTVSVNSSGLIEIQ